MLWNCWWHGSFSAFEVSLSNLWKLPRFANKSWTYEKIICKFVCAHVRSYVWLFRQEELFQISGKRLHYPQLFFVHADGITKYFGNYDTLEKLDDTSDIPPGILEARPEIETWDGVFDVVAKDTSFFALWGLDDVMLSKNDGTSWTYFDLK